VFRVQHATKILILALLCLLLAALPAHAQEATGEPTVEVTSATLEVIATAEAPTQEAGPTVEVTSATLEVIATAEAPTQEATALVEQPTAEVTAAAASPAVTPTEAAAGTNTSGESAAPGLTLGVLLFGVLAVVGVFFGDRLLHRTKDDDVLPP
jgi:hypothetical protein